MMKLWNKSVHTIMIAIVFVVLLFVITFLFQFLGQLFQQHDPYKMPRGHAVKVFQQGDAVDNNPTMLERLALFYIYGEN